MTKKEQDDRNTTAAKASKAAKDHFANIAPIDRITNREYYAQFDAEYLLEAYNSRTENLVAYPLIRWLFSAYKPENGLRLLLASDRYDDRNFLDVLLGVITAEVPTLKLTTLTEDEMSALLCNECGNSNEKLAKALFTHPAPVELAGPKTFAQVYSQYRPERSIVNAFIEHMSLTPTEYTHKKSRLANIARWLFEPRDLGNMSTGSLGNRIPDDERRQRLASMHSAADVIRAVIAASPSVYEFTEIFEYLMAPAEAKCTSRHSAGAARCAAGRVHGGTFAGLASAGPLGDLFGANRPKDEPAPEKTHEEMRADIDALFTALLDGNGISAPKDTSVPDSKKGVDYWFGYLKGLLEVGDE